MKLEASLRKLVADGKTSANIRLDENQRVIIEGFIVHENQAFDAIEFKKDCFTYRKNEPPVFAGDSAQALPFVACQSFKTN